MPERDLTDFVAKHPNVTLVVLFVAFGVAVATFASNFGPQLPPESEPQARAAAMVRLKDLCARKSACQKFGRVRQDCATAGNFDQCMQIKLGDDLLRIDSCTPDGTFRNAPADMPGVIACAGLSVP